MPEEKLSIGSRDNVFDAADTLEETGYEFVILTREKGKTGVFFLTNVKQEATAEAMCDCLTGCFGDMFGEEG